MERPRCHHYWDSPVAENSHILRHCYFSIFLLLLFSRGKARKLLSTGKCLFELPLFSFIVFLAISRKTYLCQPGVTFEFVFMYLSQLYLLNFKFTVRHSLSLNSAIISWNSCAQHSSWDPLQFNGATFNYNLPQSPNIMQRFFLF